MAALEAADDVHQLADAVLQKDGELADGGVIAAAHRDVLSARAGTASFTGTHG